MYVSANKYATRNPGSATNNSILPAGEEMWDKDELL